MLLKNQQLTYATKRRLKILFKWKIYKYHLQQQFTSEMFKNMSDKRKTLLE